MLPNIRTGILSFVWVVEMWLKSPSFLDFLGQWFPASKVRPGQYTKLQLVKRRGSNENPSLCLFSRRYSILGIYLVQMFFVFLWGRLGALWLVREWGEGCEQSNLRKGRCWKKLAIVREMLILLCLNVYTGHPKVPKGKTLTKLQKILGWESWACAWILHFVHLDSWLSGPVHDFYSPRWWWRI